MTYGSVMTFSAILERMLARVPDNVDKREGSVIYDALAPAAAELVQVYQDLDVALDETFVDTAGLQGLTLRCRERGVPIREASHAVLRGAFSPAELELTAGLRFNCGDQNYVLGEKQDDGVYLLTAETAGSAGNLYSGALLPIDYVQGLAGAEILTVAVPGSDGDTADSLRARYYASLDASSFCGNQADYRTRVGLLDGVGDVKVTPHWDGPGTVKLTVIDADFGAPAAELIASVQNAVDPVDGQGEGVGLAPIGHVVTVAGVREVKVAVAAKVSFAAGWSVADAQSQITAVLNAYFLELAKVWGDTENSVVRVSQIETRLLALDCLLDISETTVNGEPKTLALAFDEIPVLGTLTLTEEDET